MGTNVSLTAFVAGTTLSATTANSNLSAINTAGRFFFNVGSLRALQKVIGTTSSPTNFTNAMGIAPDFGVGCSSSGAFHLVCWSASGSSSTVLQAVPPGDNGGTHWSALFLVL